MTDSAHETAPLRRLSVVIPARDEEGCIASTIQHLTLELRLQDVPHEIVVVDDGSRDRTWEILTGLRATVSELTAIQNSGPHGFGRAIVKAWPITRWDTLPVPDTFDGHGLDR